MSGSLSHSPADVVRKLLIDLGFGTDPDDSDDWPIYIAREPNAPDSVITIYNTAGVKEGRVMIGGEIQEHHGIQIRLRDNDHQNGFIKARELAVALDESVALNSVSLDDIVGTGTSVYKVYAISRTSGPLAAGREPSSERNIFTINATVALLQTA